MKHIALFCLLCAACLPAAASAMTMEELLASPGRYRVLYADEAEAVYADMTTVRRASRSGGAAFSFTMYAAAYKYRPGPADYRHGTLTANIQRYDARLAADGETRAYRLDKKLTDVWDRTAGVSAGPRGAVRSPWQTARRSSGTCGSLRKPAEPENGRIAEPAAPLRGSTYRPGMGAGRDKTRGGGPYYAADA